MARTRKRGADENPGKLRDLERRYRGTTYEARIRLIRSFAENPSQTFSDASRAIGYSEQTLKRWWKEYLHGGIEALLRLRSGRPNAPGTVDDFQLLKGKILSNELASLGDIRRWLDIHPAPSFDSDTPVPDGAGDRVHDRLLGFLSALPSLHNVQEWIGELRDTLRELLGDVDRIMIALNMGCDLRDPKHYDPNLVVTQHVIEDGMRDDSVVIHSLPNASREEHLDRLIGKLEEEKFPFEEYHPPTGFTYHHADCAYLGMIVLWRARSHTPISSATIELMRRFESFFAFLLSDFVARYRCMYPAEGAFDTALAEIIRQVRISPHEQRVMVLQLLGYSYNEIARALSISQNTVRYHLKSIRAKTGTHSIHELFSKYFTPHINPERE